MRHILLVALLASLPSLAQEQDAEGCKDSKILPRFRNSVIHACDRKEFDAVDVLVGMKAEEEQLRSLEGEVEIITYDYPEGVSALQIGRNAEAALRQAGFQFVFVGKDAWNNLAVTARKGAQWVFVRLNPSNTQYTVTAVLVKEMTQEMTANAEGLAAEIEKSGRVAVYGINFDTGKATIRPDSEPVLNELVKLMTAHADWRFRIEGHTDSTGSKAANQTLSAQRAASVAAWLSAQGIDKARLTTQGFGDSKPVADNGTEEGRAKNRRVELVKM
jgi:outer membrane protein OmpA-like peptidoglycan-associated protein